MTVNTCRMISSLVTLRLGEQMTFNRSMCYVMHMSHKKNSLLISYEMLCVPLEPTRVHKYLGVELTSDLDWSIRINSISTKSDKTLGLSRRHFRNCSPKTKEAAYKSLVRPQLEYWDHTRMVTLLHLRKSYAERHDSLQEITTGSPVLHE